MQAIKGVAGPATRLLPDRAAEPAASPRDLIACSRALVPVASVATHKPIGHVAGRPVAAFLAHLVATGQRAPQTRVLRRTAPAEAASVYGAMLNARRPMVSAGGFFGRMA